MEQDDPRVHRFYRTVGCVFNNKRFFANIQADDRVVNICFDLEDEYMWKAMSPSKLEGLRPNPAIGCLMPSNRENIEEDEKMLESALKEKIGSVRSNEHKLSTVWDS